MPKPIFPCFVVFIFIAVSDSIKLQAFLPVQRAVLILLFS